MNGPLTWLALGFCVLGLAVVIASASAWVGIAVARRRTPHADEDLTEAVRRTRAADYHHAFYCDPCKANRPCMVGRRLDVEARRARLKVDGHPRGEAPA